MVGSQSESSDGRSDAVELSAVVVGFNSQDNIASTVKALHEALVAIPHEVIVVDNASSDDTAGAARAAIEHGQVIVLDENVGYGRGANPGIAAARGRVCMVMNDDVVISLESVRLMIEALDSSPDVRLVAPRMVDPDGATLPTARRYLPGLRDEIARLADFVTGRNSRVLEPPGGPPFPVDFALAACVLARTEDLREMGGFSDAFFMYGEDIDLCRRIKSLGGRVMLVPDAEACHDQAVAEDRRIRGHDFSERILNARDTYYRTWLPRWERMVINAFRAFGLSDQPFRLRYHLPKAIYDGPNLTDYRRPAPLPRGD